MALLIEKVSDSGFEFQLDGGNVIRDNAPNMTSFNGLCDFKTKNGANLYQRIDFTTVTILDTFGGTGSFTYTDIRLFWLKLTELKFFDGINSGGGGGGVDRFDELLDTLAYYTNNGKVPIVNESANRLDYSIFYNVQNFTDLADCPSSLLANKLVTTNSLGTGLVFIDLPSDPQQYLNAFGWGVYQDETTQTTPLAYTTGLLQITNDGDGTKTQKSYFPFGVSDTFNVSTNEFDFSQFNIGDVVRLEVNLEVTTTVTNQNVTIDFKSAIGGALEETNRVYENELSAIGVLSVNFVTEILIKNSDIVSFPSQLLFSSNNNCDIIVNTFKTVCVRKDINYTEINATDNTANHYKGNYNASTNTPTLANGIGNIGDEYKVTVSGTQNFGAGAIAFFVDDYIGYDGFLWHKKINNNQSGGGGGGTSNLSLTATPTSHIISNTNGTGFTTPLADAINAGLMLPSEKTKVAAIDQAVSTVEKSTWNGKQDSLVSGTNIKTINGNSVLGSGNLVLASIDEFLGKEIQMTMATTSGFTQTGRGINLVTGIDAIITNTSSSVKFLQTMRRRVTSAATAGSSVIFGDETFKKVYMGRNYTSYFIFGNEDVAPVANARLFVGYHIGSSLGNVNPSTLTSIIGVAADTGDTNLQIIHNDASGLCTKIDLGSAFPSNTSSLDFYLVKFEFLTSGNVTITVTNLETNTVSTNTVSTNKDAIDTHYFAVAQRNNGSTALALRFSLIHWSVIRNSY
jgi:hypothetical protein